MAGRYQNTLQTVFLQGGRPRLGRWIQEAVTHIPERTLDIDLVVHLPYEHARVADPNHVLLVQALVLCWIAEGRPFWQVGREIKGIKAALYNMPDHALAGYLNQQEELLPQAALAMPPPPARVPQVPVPNRVLPSPPRSAPRFAPIPPARAPAPQARVPNRTSPSPPPPPAPRFAPSPPVRGRNPAMVVPNARMPVPPPSPRSGAPAPPPLAPPPRPPALRRRVSSGPAPVRAGGDPGKLVAKALPELDLCKKFVCNDAVQFDGDINPEIGKEGAAVIIQRARQARQAVAPPPMMQRVWNEKWLAQSYASIFKQKAGECTSFGVAAAHILSQVKMAPQPRIELVAWDGAILRTNPNTGKSFRLRVSHVFCVVGRQGKHLEGPKTVIGQKHLLPDFKDWNEDCWIVDPWLASLGWEAAYPLADYPKPGFLSPLTLYMDSWSRK